MNGDILLVHPVQDHGVCEVVNHGVNGDLRVKQDQDGRIKQGIEAQRKFTHRKSTVPLAHDESQHVQSAAAAAAGEDDSAADPGEDAAQQAGRQIIVHNGLRGNGNDAVKNRVGYRTDDGPHRQSPAQVPIPDHEQRDVQQKIEDACDVVGPEAHAQEVLQQRSHQLAEAQQAAGVQAQGDNEEIQRRGRDQLAQHGEHQPQDSVVQGSVQHG